MYKGLSEEFYSVEEEFRDFSKTRIKDIDTPTEFGDAWFGFVVGIAVIASMDEVANEVYNTNFPENVGILDLQEFIKKLEGAFDGRGREEILKKGYLARLEKSKINRIGREVFGTDWRDIKPKIMVSEATPDAHPILFQVEAERTIEFERGTTRTIEETLQVYPLHYANLLKFQMFPLMNNDDNDAGDDILKEVIDTRSEEYEVNVYDYLSDRSRECYLRAEILGEDGSEIDILRITEDNLDFIELKYLLPPSNIKTKGGIQELDRKFDGRVFDEDPERDYSTNNPFHKKVDKWLDEPSSMSFTSEGCDKVDFRDSWTEKEVRRLVVSNLTPSYPEKHGVRFLTGLEFYQMVEESEDVFYSVRD